MIKRLGDKIIRPSLNALNARATVIKCRYQDNRNLGQPPIGAQPPADLKAIHHRHHHIEQDEIGGQGLGLLERVKAIGGKSQLIGRRLQKRLQNLAPGLRIVNNQDHTFCLQSHTPYQKDGP